MDVYTVIGTGVLLVAAVYLGFMIYNISQLFKD